MKPTFCTKNMKSAVASSTDGQWDILLDGKDQNR